MLRRCESGAKHLTPSSGKKSFCVCNIWQELVNKSIYLVVLNLFNIATKNIAIPSYITPPPLAYCLVLSVQNYRELSCGVERFHCGTKIDPRVKTQRDIRPKCSLSHSDSKGSISVWQGGELFRLRCPRKRKCIMVLLLFPFPNESIGFPTANGVYQ